MGPSDPNFATNMTSMTAAGGLMGTASNLIGMSVQRTYLEHEAALKRENAAAADQQSAAEFNRLRQVSERRIGAQRAAFAKAGIAGGSEVDVEHDTAVQGELQALTALYKGSLISSRERSEAGNLQQQARYIGGQMPLAAAGGLAQTAGASAMTYSFARQPRSSMYDYSLDFE